MIEIAMIAIIVIALAALYYYKNKENKKPGTYIWVGPGEDPFKK